MLVALRGRTEFQSRNQAMLIKDGRANLWRRNNLTAQNALVWVTGKLPATNKKTAKGGDNQCLGLHPKIRVQWDRTGGSGVGGFNITLLQSITHRPTPSFNRHEAQLFIIVTLDCKKGGIFNTCHKILCDGDSDMAIKAFTPLHVHQDPLIYTVCTMRDAKTLQAGYFPPKNCHSLRMIQSIRETLSSGNSGKMVQIVFTSCVL